MQGAGLFRIRSGGQRHSNRVESWLALVEGRAGAVYTKISGRQPLEDEEKITWAVFVASLFLRTRKVRHQLAPMTLRRVQDMMIGDEAIRQMQHELFMGGRLFPYEYLRSRMIKVWTEMEDPAFGHLIAIENSVLTLAQNLLAKDWYVVDAPERSSFITSDAPVVSMKLTEGGAAFLGYGFGQRDVAAILPMSPYKAFIASPLHIRWRDLDQNSFTLINRAIAAFADRYIYADVESSQIQALTDAELGQIRYGDNAFRAS